MPAKPRRVRYKAVELAPYEDAYLRDYPVLLTEFARIGWLCFRAGVPYGLQHPRELWHAHKAEYLPAYIAQYPGKRPYAWWQWDAPQEEGGIIPRQRCGGQGEAYRDVRLCYGVPSAWKWVSPENPPCFETQAKYLKRHKLLTAGELKALTKVDYYKPERIILLTSDTEDPLREQGRGII